jgi:hypothetical protein
MEILQENLLNIIREKCSSGWELNVFEDHIIVNIIRCVKQHFPDRDFDILFEVRNGSWNCSFKIGKT